MVLCKTQKCARSSERTKSLRRDGTWNLSIGRRVCCWCGCPRTGGAGLGDEWRWHQGHWHTQAQQFLGPPAAACSWWMVAGALPRRQTPGRPDPHRALADRGLWLVTHPSKPKALRWSQYIFGLFTSDRYYGSTFLSWNLKPKALSCWSAEDSQIAKYLVVNLKGNIKSTICFS